MFSVNYCPDLKFRQKSPNMSCANLFFLNSSTTSKLLCGVARMFFELRAHTIMHILLLLGRTIVGNFWFKHSQFLLACSSVSTLIQADLPAPILFTEKRYPTIFLSPLLQSCTRGMRLLMMTPDLLPHLSDKNELHTMDQLNDRLPACVVFA